MRERQLTVSRVYPYSSTLMSWRSIGRSRPSCQPPLVPFLRLCGRWLATAGFDIGDHVRVEVEPGRLVVTLDEG